MWIKLENKSYLCPDIAVVLAVRPCESGEFEVRADNMFRGFTTKMVLGSGYASDTEAQGLLDELMAASDALQLSPAAVTTS